MTVNSIKEWAVTIMQGSTSETDVTPIIRDGSLAETLSDYTTLIESSEHLDQILDSKGDVAVFTFDSSIIHEIQKKHIHQFVMIAIHFEGTDVTFVSYDLNTLGKHKTEKLGIEVP